MTMDPKLFAEGPMRDPRFDVREKWAEMDNLPANHPDMSLEFLTRQMNEEINATEMAARNLVDFPDADWGLRMEIARQAADEARHAMAFRRLLEQRGGWVGQFPVINFQFRIMMMIPSLIGRLTVANRSFEAAGMGIQTVSDLSRRTTPNSSACSTNSCRRNGMSASPMSGSRKSYPRGRGR